MIPALLKKAFVITLLLHAVQSYGIDIVGPILSDSHWTFSNSPYVVTGNVLVGQGVTLSIEPGVEIKFDGDFYFQVDGALTAIGTSAQPIVFTSNNPAPAPGDWGGTIDKPVGIYFTDFSQDWNGSQGCILDHCLIEYGGGIVVRNASPLIRDCVIQKCGGIADVAEAGAILLLGSHSLIVGNRIIDNVVTGQIHRYSPAQSQFGSAGAIHLSSFRSDENEGVVIRDNLIGNNRITATGSIEHIAGGILVRPAKDTVIEGNLIVNNHAGQATQSSVGGISNVQSSTVISGNTVIGNDGFDGGGIAAYNISVTENNLYDNRSASGPNDLAILAHSQGPQPPPDLDGSDNWWGQETTAEMEEEGPNSDIAAIHDFFDDFEVGRVLYEGWATESFPNPFSSLPSFEKVEVTPNPAFTTDTLTAIPTGWFDENGDAEFYFYQWIKNGQDIQGATGPNLAGSNFKRDDVVKVVATPFDGVLFGIARESEPLTINNSPPSQPTIDIIPKIPTPDDFVSVRIAEESIDPDDDLVVYLYEWYEATGSGNFHRRPELSGNETPFNQGQPEVSPNFLQFADKWRIDVTPFDAQLLGKSKYDRGKSRGAKESLRFEVLPDVDGDDRITSSDFISFLKCWMKSKSEVEEEYRGVFFDDSDPETRRIGEVELLELLRYERR